MLVVVDADVEVVVAVLLLVVVDDDVVAVRVVVAVEAGDSAIAIALAGPSALLCCPVSFTVTFLLRGGSVKKSVKGTMVSSSVGRVVVVFIVLSVAGCARVCAAVPAMTMGVGREGAGKGTRENWVRPGVALDSSRALR